MRKKIVLLIIVGLLVMGTSCIIENAVEKDLQSVISFASPTELNDSLILYPLPCDGGPGGGGGGIPG
jgi:hypothetical protein